MNSGFSLGGRIVTEELLARKLLTDAHLIGGIYTMGYEECLVLTNDIWKQQAGGIPQHCFLLATPMTIDAASTREDEEVILLRVVGPASLPAEADLVEVRAEAMREILTSRSHQVAVSAPAALDVLTRNEIQFSAVKAKVLGTFFDTDVAGSQFLALGSDIDTYYSASRYKVYKPFGASLELIASYPSITEDEQQERQRNGIEPSRVRLGVVRYSSTRRRSAIEPHPIEAPVRVNVHDFVSMKTAVFGMTRLGKSNAMKIIATAVFQYAADHGTQIGQLLFDPSAEYSKVNDQDKTALARIGSEFVTTFRYDATGAEVGIRPLSSNFFSDDSVEVTWSIIVSYLRVRKHADYVQSFLAADVIGPEKIDDDRSAYSRAIRRRCALYATLMKANFAAPPQFTITIGANKDVITAVNSQISKQHTDPSDTGYQFVTNDRGDLRLTLADICLFWDSLIAARKLSGSDVKKKIEEWIDAELDAILVMYQGSKGSGFRLLEPLKAYHSVSRADDYADEILHELIKGKIVIVDLSLGSETILRFCSERIINRIVEDAATRFAGGLAPHPIQIFIEEAHRLLNREKMNAPEEADPYIRLAKEAAKFKIGLIYATQEVSSVDPIILANTSNWVVTHLNNRNEIKELSKYYEFEDFQMLTLRAEDVGFARVKTRSGRYIIPTQIDLFDASRVAQARTAGLRSFARRTI